jgi:hypothetical protein
MRCGKAGRKPNIGAMEYWSVGVLSKTEMEMMRFPSVAQTTTPLLQYSITPVTFSHNLD